MGVRDVPRAPRAAAIPREPSRFQRDAAPRALVSDHLAPSTPSLPLAPRKPHSDPVAALARLKNETIGDCQRCTLAPTRTHVVFGVGNPRAGLVFVGEAPGADEDAQGIPFVGRAGQLLTKIIEAMGLRRDDVYIANIIKCRPPGNRNPQPDEIAACEPFLIEQLDIIRPRVICALGTFSAQTLLKTKDPISRLRGRWHVYQGIKLMPTFHPAYLLRNPGEKKAVWEDMQQVMSELGLSEPPKKPTPRS
ncbi:MAG: uracil-DNA glycosylase [Nitrospirae bacterium]|nr:uracil-DNA glycosylase [Nitrospirota bacterium]